MDMDSFCAFVELTLLFHVGLGSLLWHHFTCQGLLSFSLLDKANHIMLCELVVMLNELLDDIGSIQIFV